MKTMKIDGNQIVFHYDYQACVWTACSDVVPGLVLEDSSIDRLIERVKEAIPDLKEANDQHLKASPDVESSEEGKMVLSYRGYTGSVEFSEADQCYFGKIQGIRSLVSYEGKDLEELDRDFCDAVDDFFAEEDEEFLNRSFEGMHAVKNPYAEVLKKQKVIYVNGKPLTREEFLSLGRCEPSEENKNANEHSEEYQVVSDEKLKEVSDRVTKKNMEAYKELAKK